MEEFQEADMLWGEPKRKDTARPIPPPPSPTSPQPKVSTPIPIHVSQHPWKLNFLTWESDVGDEIDDEEEWLPPHVIVAHRYASQMRISGNCGTGRTLGWRQMTYLRNTVLRLTGYIEA